MVFWDKCGFAYVRSDDVRAICLDIGGTSIKYGVLEEAHNEMNIIHKASYDWSPVETDGTGVPQLAYELIEDLLDQYQVDFIGVSTAGMVDTDRGQIKYANDNIPNYTGVPLKKELEDLTKLQVAVENDVNCAALAEHFYGASRDSNSSICLTIGTGVGGGLIIRDDLWQGAHSGAMEVGYMPLKDGLFDQIASTTGLVKRCSARMDTDQPLNGKIIFDLARNHNNEIAISEIDRMIKYLVEGINILVTVVDPEVVVLGGGIIHQADYLMPRINKALDKDRISDVKVLPAENLNNAGLIGAFVNGRKQLMGD